MSLWIEDAVILLTKPSDTFDVDRFAQRCQEQVVFAYRMEFLKNIAGSVNSYRDACQQALNALLPAVEIHKRIPEETIKPLEDDHPKVKDDWERAHQRRVKQLDERNKLLAVARRHLEDAQVVAQSCLDWRPEHLSRVAKKADEEKKAEPAGAAKGK